MKVNGKDIDAICHNGIEIIRVAQNGAELWAGGLPVGTVYDFDYTGAVQTIELPRGSYKLECWGAQGGTYSSSYAGGKGGYSVGVLTLKADTTLYIYAGGQGSKITVIDAQAGGGFNGGGKATTTTSSYYTCGGGGGTDVRVGTDSLYARVIVAGAGGGAMGATTGYGNGGVGGGTSGGTGASSSSSYTAGKGGTATAVGTSYYSTTAQSSGSTRSDLGGFGYGASAKTSSSYSCGGGGGWYGGGSARRAGGGGGSGYVYTSSTASNYPSGCLLETAHYLTDAETIAGNASMPSTSGDTETGHSGNGYVRITVV